MERLILVRHAKSDWSTAGPDIDRPLNERGKGDIARIAKWLADELATSSVEIVHSPALRARETAVVLHQTLTHSQLKVDENLYLATKSELIEAIEANSADTLMLVAHNPGLEELVNWLDPDLGSRVEANKIFPTAGVYAYKLSDGLKPGTLQFVFHQRPKRLAD